MVLSTADYAHCVEQAGGVPVLLPLQATAAFDALLGRLDGLLLAGGEDINPAVYGGRVNRHVGRMEPRRDAYELALLDRALELGLPILGICRGCQLLNAFFGGTLHRDLEAERPGEVFHATTLLPKEETTHIVDLAEGSTLARALDRTTLAVNSFHHQGIESLGDGLQAVGWAADGLVEALEHPGHSFVLGVQWHPEMMTEAHPEQSTPFRLLVEAANQ